MPVHDRSHCEQTERNEIDSEDSQQRPIRSANPHVWILADDMYEHIMFDARRFVTFAEAAPQLSERTLVVNGASKAYAMTGWRLGYGAGPASLIRAMARMQAQCSLNPSSISQAAAVAALNGPQDLVAQRCTEFQVRRDKVVPLLDAIPGLSCTRPDGAFYIYISCAGWIGRHTPDGKELVTDADVGAYLLESGVAVPEGAGYGLSPYFRASFATSLEKLEEACRRMDAAARQLA